MPIPSILHQMWADDRLPEKWSLCRETWKRFHPEWQHLLWTDQSLREFVAAHYPDFLLIYDAYPKPIMRADAARYLILDHFGGVYADMDTECLQEMGPLLAGEELLLPMEPEAHVSSSVAAESKIRRIVGNAWMASSPGHPFWKHVLDEMIRRRHLPGPLVTTGPFLLSEVVNRLDLADTPRLLASESVFPATNLDMEWLEARVPSSPHWFGPKTYAIHYWNGSWWRKKKNLVKTYLLSNAAPVLSGWMDEAKAARQSDATSMPLVSCLMVTGKRPHLATLAIEAFRRQTYPHKELVIIDDSGSEALAPILIDNDASIRWIRVPQENKPLGALRNLALAEARGDLLCQWDDDDLSAPGRIERQVRALIVAGAEACGLSRLQLWWPARDWMATSSSRVWECALLWRKGAIAAYPELRAGEDTPPVKGLVARSRVAMIDSPGLYTYTYHGENTFPDAHWQSLWLAANARITGTACRLKLQLMQGLLPCEEYLKALNLEGFEQADRSAPATPVPAGTTSGSPLFTATVSKKTTLPRVLIATPVKDAVPFLEGFFANLLATDYPSEKLSLAFLESDSSDATPAHAEQLLSRHRERFSRTQLVRKDFGLHLSGVRWEPSIQDARRSILARSRNQLLESALGEEDWVLWIDVDVVSWPPDILHRLMNDERAIVTPHCVQTPRGPSFDLNSFVFKNHPAETGNEDALWLEGNYRPPLDGSRLYLDAFRDQEEVALDSVGGTMLLVPGDLHRDGLRFPARPYRGHLETEGLAMMAKSFGVACRGLPQVEIIHA